jgi:uncharacterized SAM-binding protein YcdF (DUF218 family)
VQVYEFLVGLLEPDLLLYLLTGLAILNLRRRRSESPRRLTLVTAAFAALTAVSTPVVAYLAVGTLEWQYQPVDQRPTDAQAIVVLACGVLSPTPTRERGELDRDTTRRCRHAAALYHQGLPCPVLVSGGKVSAESLSPAGAPLMRDYLVELGVCPSDLIVEDRSRTTYENAVESHAMLEEKGIRRVVLVTDAVDLFRAERCFRKVGLEVIPSGSDYRTSRFRWGFLAFVPSPSAAAGCRRAWHEWLGTAWYALRGRV